MRLPLINASLWYDEAFTWMLSNLPLDRWWSALAGDVHPPLFYFLEWLIAHLTTSVWAMRLLPLTFGVLAVYLGVKVAQALGATVPGQVGTALLLAFLPQQIYYSDELRMYSLLSVLYLAGVWCVLCRRWSWLTLVFIGLTYTHHYGWIYSATLGLYALWQERMVTLSVLHVLLAGGLAILAYLPLLPTTLGQVSGTGAFWATLGLDAVVMVMVGWLTGYSFSLPSLTALLIVGTLAVLMAVTWRAIVRRHYVLLWLVAAPLVFGLALSLAKNVWLGRGFIGAGAMAAVLIAVELTQTNRARWAALALLGTLLAFGSVCDETRTTVDQRFATPDFVAYLRGHLQPGDVVMCQGAASWMELQPYRLTVPVIMDETGDHRATGGLSEQTRVAMVGDVHYTPGRTWVFTASLATLEPEPPKRAVLIKAWQSPELRFHSALYLQENYDGYIRR